MGRKKKKQTKDGLNEKTVKLKNFVNYCEDLGQ